MSEAPTIVAPNAEESAEAMYLDLLKRCLTRSLFPEKYAPLKYSEGTLRQRILGSLQPALQARNMVLCRKLEERRVDRDEGRFWPSEAETMVGLKRLDNVQHCVTEVLRSGVPGDLIETGVWRGGTTIFMRAILRAYGDAERRVWVADSFEGLPPPNPDRYPSDKGDQTYTFRELAISLEEVQANFDRYGLLDDQVQFLKGWFRDTLTTAPIERLAIARLDGDMYESTMDALVNLYPKLSVGGYLIVDDYGAINACQQAVDDFRRERKIKEEMIRIDWTGVYWRRSS